MSRVVRWLDCVGSCGKKVRSVDGNICRDCFNRVPLALRREWFKATQPCGAMHRNKRVIQAEIQAWVRANPAPPRTAEVPSWRRHGRGRTDG